MDLFTGLKAAQIGALRHLRGYQTYHAGQKIFNEGDPAAEGLFVVISGSVQIFRLTKQGEVEVARLGHQQAFGEMGMLNDMGWRTASARALEDTTLMHFGSNPIQIFQDIGDPEAALKILQNLVGLLGERLRAKDREGWVPLQLRAEPLYPNLILDAQASLEKLRESLPQGILRRILGGKKLAPGEYLCSQGDAPEGFYFIQEGILKVEQKKPDGSEALIGTIHAPSIAGEIGFFSNEKRSSSLKATTEVRYDFFSGEKFRKLAAQDPKEAFDLLFAVAQLVVCLIMERENG